MKIPNSNNTHTTTEQIDLKEQVFQLGYDYIIHPKSNEISMLSGFKIGASLKVEPRIMQVLLCLSESQNEVVPKSELIQKIWNNYGGAEDALMQTISKLRKFLQDDAKQQRAIQTIPKKGYRLLLPIRIISPNMLDQLKGKEIVSTRMAKIGSFTGFIERLTHLKFFLAFMFFSVVVIMVLAILSYIVFWAR